MLSLLENANKICATENARAEYSKAHPLSISSSSGDTAGGGSSDTAPTAATAAVLAASPPALESMLVYTKFRGLGFRMRELGYMLRCSELAEEEGDANYQHNNSHGGSNSSSLRVGGVLDPTKSAYSSEDFLNHFNTSRNTSAGKAASCLSCLVL